MPLTVKKEFTWIMYQFLNVVAENLLYTRSMPESEDPIQKYGFIQRTPQIYINQNFMGAPKVN